MTKIDIDRLTGFIVNAKKIKYNLALESGATVDDLQCREFDHQDNEFLYMDKPLGKFSGSEEVRRGATIDSPVIWTLQYHGNMRDIFSASEQASIAYTFLRSALLHLPEKLPLRGPPIYLLPAGDSSWVYVNDLEGELTRFKGHEKIFFEGSEVCSGDYIGGLVT